MKRRAKRQTRKTKSTNTDATTGHTGQQETRGKRIGIEDLEEMTLQSTGRTDTGTRTQGDTGSALTMREEMTADGTVTGGRRGETAMNTGTAIGIGIRKDGEIVNETTEDMTEMVGTTQGTGGTGTMSALTRSQEDRVEVGRHDGTRTRDEPII